MRSLEQEVPEYMSQYAIYYTESNIICLIIFGIILIHDLFSIDRQEKQIKYDHALIAFMCYFVSDALWALTIAGVIPKNEINVAITNFANYLFMAGIAYMWLLYVMALEQVPGRNDPLRKVAVGFPFFAAAVALIVVYIVNRSLLFDEELMPKTLYNVFLIAVPIIYIIAVLIYALRKASRESNPIEKRNHIFVGILPLFVIAGGLLQTIVLPDTPIFCFCCAILMLTFNIMSMETSISVDPLTGLNNRGQLMKLISTKNSFQAEGKRTYIAMIDINDFKSVNDTYGHAEGDNALVIIADSLKKAVNKSGHTLFCGRYGGDEFIMIIQAETTATVDGLIEQVRDQIKDECDRRKTPYILSVGAGYDEMRGASDSFKNCIQRADGKMYEDKDYRKKNGMSTVIQRNAAR